MRQEQKIGEQVRPNLPADSIFVVLHEVRQLQGPLDFLEKNFDSPHIVQGLSGISTCSRFFEQNYS